MHLQGQVGDEQRGGGGEGADPEILISVMNQLTEKLENIKILDRQILGHLKADAEISEEVMSQDDKNLEIEITIEKMKAILKKHSAGESFKTPPQKVLPSLRQVGAKKAPSSLSSPNWRLNVFRGTPWSFRPLSNNLKPQLGTQT